MIMTLIKEIGDVSKLVEANRSRVSSGVYISHDIEIMSEEIIELIKKGKENIASVYDSAHTQKHTMSELSDMSHHMTDSSFYVIKN